MSNIVEYFATEVEATLQFPACTLRRARQFVVLLMLYGKCSQDIYIFCSFSAALTHGMYNFEIDGCGMLVSLFIVCSLFSAAKITLLQHTFESLQRGSNSSIAKH